LILFEDATRTNGQVEDPSTMGAWGRGESHKKGVALCQNAAKLLGDHEVSSLVVIILKKKRRNTSTRKKGLKRSVLVGKHGANKL